MAAERKTLTQLSVPIGLETLFYMLSGMVDTLMLSSVSDQAVGAVGTANTYIGVFIIMFGVISSGMIAVMSQNIGAGRPGIAYQARQLGLIFNALIGIVMSVILATFSGGILRIVSIAPALEKEQAAQKLSELLGHAVEVVPAAEMDNFVKDKASAAPLLKPFTPDHIVYCGPYPLFVENIDQAKEALDAFMKENDKEPRLILVQGVGGFIMEDDKGKAAKAQLLVKDAIKLAVYAESFGGALQMTDDITYFITHWEAEAYRSKK